MSSAVVAISCLRVSLLQLLFVQINVIPNQAPTLTSPTGPVNVNENEEAQRKIYTVNVTDPEGDAVSCDISAVSPSSSSFGIWQGTIGK